MNKVKYKDSLYNPREISDLRELLAESFETHADQAAFLYKDKKVGKFVPVSENLCLLHIADLKRI